MLRSDFVGTIFVSDTINCVVLVDENTNGFEGKLGRWREVLDKNELKISKAETEIFEFALRNEVRINESDYNVRL